MISMVSVMGPVFSMWSEYPELLLLFFIANTCSLYLVWNVLPVWPMYFTGQSSYQLKWLVNAAVVIFV
jgi:hypothetical protein